MTLRLALALSAVVGLSWTGCKKSAPADATGPSALEQPKPLDADDPEACRPCHAPIVDEFLTSMHARAHHAKDPIYAGVRRLRMGKEGKQVSAACRGCHTPRAEDASQDDAPLALAGVSCGSCHAVSAVHPGKMGRAALVWAPTGMLLGPHDIAAGASPAHATGPAPAHMKDGKTLCLACHDTLAAGSGVALCSTGDEHRTAASAGSGGHTCVSCHMPRIAGAPGAMSRRQDHASHRFLGPHHRWYSAPDALAAERRTTGPPADIAAAFDGDALLVTLSNRSGHGFPSGFPGRMAVVAAVGYDASGKQIWASPGPPKPLEDARHVLKKVYVDGDGRPTLAPWATALKIDSRLTPGEQRVLRFTVPASVARAEAKLVMRLLPPPLADKLGLAGDAVERAPRVIGAATARRQTAP